MLAYRHAFHAGTRMGIDDAEALVLGRLWQRTDLPAAVADYVGLVRQFNADGKLAQYPGSPALAQMLLRPQDELRCFELHPTDYKILSSFLPGTATMGDGFAALKGQLPPPTRRGVVLIDPPYELKADYARTLAAFREALERFADGVVVVWLPQLALLESRQLPQRLKASADALAKKGWLHARLTVARADAKGFGLIGSHVLVANPPHTLAPALRSALPWLARELAQFDGAEGVVEVSAKG